VQAAGVPRAGSWEGRGHCHCHRRRIINGKEIAAQIRKRGRGGSGGVPSQRRGEGEHGKNSHQCARHNAHTTPLGTSRLGRQGGAWQEESRRVQSQERGQGHARRGWGHRHTPHRCAHHNLHTTEGTPQCAHQKGTPQRAHPNWHTTTGNHRGVAQGLGRRSIAHGEAGPWCGVFLFPPGAGPRACGGGRGGAQETGQTFVAHEDQRRARRRGSRPWQAALPASATEEDVVAKA